MKLSEVCIKRPVFATVLSLLIVLIGAISYSRLTVREYPQIDEPVVSVTTVYKGASAEVIESQVTKPLEDSLSGIEGVQIMSSASRAERSNINVKFRLNISPDAAAADVRDKVARVRGRLPDEVDEPIIAKVEADSQPVIQLAVEAGSLSSMEASDYINRFIKPRLSVLPRRGRSARVWRAPAGHARQCGSQQAGRVPADRAGSRRRPARAERRDPVGPHRIAGARILGRGRDQFAHARRIPPRRDCQRQRLQRHDWRCGRCAAGPGGRTRHVALQRAAGAEHRCRQTVDRQPARPVESGAPRD